ncbi:ead/Ea22-like family protein [Salmonella enterica]
MTIDKQALRISELEELNELLREKVKKLESDLWDKEQLRQVYSEKSFNLECKVRELEARNQKDFVWRGKEISRLNDEVDELKEKLEAAEMQIVNLKQNCENDPRIHEIVDLKESVAELATENARIAEQREYYEGVIADGSKRIAELEAKLETADKLQDSAFRDGLKAGFSYGQTDDQSGFTQCMSAYSTHAGIKVKGE